MMQRMMQKMKMRSFWCKRALLIAAAVNLLLIAYVLLFHHSGGGGGGSNFAVVDINYGDDVISDVGAAGSGTTSTGGGHRAAVQRQLVDKMRLSLPASDEASCARLLAGDPAEQQRALALSRARRVPPDYRNDEFYAGQSCQWIRSRFVTETLSAEEASFPLAMSLTVFKDFYQVEKLFRAVYRPEHYYCFHVDSKADPVFHRAVTKYAECLGHDGGNVVVSDKRLDVSWGRFSVLEADLLCMQRLVALSRRWRYFINLTGQEFPLRTTLELVRILRGLRGANNMENAGPRDVVPRLEVRLPDGGTAPIRWHKGSVHISATRGFVEFAVSSTGKQISEHLRAHSRWPAPDETFFATLNNNPAILKVPGADKTGLLTDNVRQPFLNRYKNWIFGVFGYPCLSGNIVRQICIWGVRDLPAMDKRVELFVNKFYYNFERLGLQCMEERFWNNTRADYNVTGYWKTNTVPLHFYSDFEFVRNHV